jgi:hypothetical protein
MNIDGDTPVGGGSPALLAMKKEDPAGLPVGLSDWAMERLGPRSKEEARATG